MFSSLQVWNFEFLNATQGQVYGNASAAYETLAPQQNNSVFLGILVQATQNNIQPLNITINGQQCKLQLVNNITGQFPIATLHSPPLLDLVPLPYKRLWCLSQCTRIDLRQFSRFRFEQKVVACGLHGPQVGCKLAQKSRFCFASMQASTPCLLHQTHRQARPRAGLRVQISQYLSPMVW